MGMPAGHQESFELILEHAVVVLSLPVAILCEQTVLSTIAIIMEYIGDGKQLHLKRLEIMSQQVCLQIPDADWQHEGIAAHVKIST